MPQYRYIHVYIYIHIQKQSDFNLYVHTYACIHIITCIYDPMQDLPEHVRDARIVVSLIVAIPAEGVRKAPTPNRPQDPSACTTHRNPKEARRLLDSVGAAVKIAGNARGHGSYVRTGRYVPNRSLRHAPGILEIDGTGSLCERRSKGEL